MNITCLNGKLKHLCKHCAKAENIEYLFYFCQISQDIWVSIHVCTWIYNNLKSEYRLSPTDILFGIPSKNDVYLHTVNYMILTGKMYIHKCKLDGRNNFSWNT